MHPTAARSLLHIRAHRPISAPCPADGEVLPAEIHKALHALVEMAALLPDEPRPYGNGRAQRDGDELRHHRQHAFEQEAAAVAPAQELEHRHQLARQARNDVRFSVCPWELLYP